MRRPRGKRGKRDDKVVGPVVSPPPSSSPARSKFVGRVRSPTRPAQLSGEYFYFNLASTRRLFDAYRCAFKEEKLIFNHGIEKRGGKSVIKRMKDNSSYQVPCSAFRHLAWSLDGRGSVPSVYRSWSVVVSRSH